MAKAVDENEGEQAVADAAPKPKARRRAPPKLALIIGGALIALGAAGAGAYAFGALDLLFAGDAADAKQEAKLTAGPVYYSLPDLLVSLNTGERRSTFLKVKVILQLQDEEDRAGIERLLPRVIDYCQVYLRELRLDELRGSAGTTRLREELLRRTRTALAPIQVIDVLFGEIFVQ